MPEIQIRSVTKSDLPQLIAFDHSYITDSVWQMDLQVDENRVGVIFRETRLPRSVRLDYPKDPILLADNWEKFSAILVAVHKDQTIGYITLMKDVFNPIVRMSDLVVVRRFRRQGVGKILLFAAQEWAANLGNSQLILEMQSKNFPAICLAQKLGFEFCGYSDRNYTNKDIMLFFGKSLR